MLSTDNRLVIQVDQLDMGRSSQKKRWVKYFHKTLPHSWNLCISWLTIFSLTLVHLSTSSLTKLHCEMAKVNLPSNLNRINQEWPGHRFPIQLSIKLQADWLDWLLGTLCTRGVSAHSSPASTRSIILHSVRAPGPPLSSLAWPVCNTMRFLGGAGRRLHMQRPSPAVVTMRQRATVSLVTFV